MNKAPPLPMPTAADLAKLQQLKRAETTPKPAPAPVPAPAPAAAPTPAAAPPPAPAPAPACARCGVAFGAVCFAHEGRQYCETCFCAVNGYECVRCRQPIVDGTVMRAETLGIWHMERCFRCGECDEVLGDGSTFVTDGRLPYHAHHQPERCGGCRRFVGRDTPRIKALGQLFHCDCLRCARCNQALGDSIHTAGDTKQPFCQPCAQSVASAAADARATGDAMHVGVPVATGATDPCAACGTQITAGATVAGSQRFHPACFLCSRCRNPLGGEFHRVNGKMACAVCASLERNDVCSRCQRPIVDETIVQALQKNFHAACLCCAVCSAPLHGKPLYDRGGGVVACEQHAIET